MSYALTAGDKAVIRNIVGRLHISCTDTDICLEMGERLPNASKQQLREACRYAVSVHHQNQGLYKRVMRGGF